MSFRDRIYDLQTPEEVDEFLEQYPSGAIFKAGGCHKTMQAFTCVEEALEPYESLYLGFVRVIECRAASNHVANLTGVQHESPQFVLFKDGKAVLDMDNWDITLEALQEGVEPFLGMAANVPGGERVSTDLTQYLRLLEGYVGGEIAEPQFSSEWLTLFQADAAPRSKREFDQLNSLFGDVDQALLTGARDGDLRVRATQLLENLS